MSSSLSHPERVAVARLHAMLELLPTALDKRLGDAGVTAFEHTLLTALVEREARRMRLSELARTTNATLPRISRVATSLEKRGLIERAPCPEDGRATNAVLTAAGVATQQRSRELYDDAVRELVFAGLAQLPGDGVAQLTDLTLAVLTSLDPDHPRTAGATATQKCAADPAPGAASEPTGEPSCAADPAPENLGA
ncbi:MarR family winged helix-turn-helix transcriptional regulator [Leucobacter aridicollis]|uniref:MarR family winged helix-turn-helix transcriptional regulator n=1 Tax=Leucobacter aridicollis TaxID=283878 RepID=UPI00216797AC|nr:MarR family transcriptional regulator [Leucobacter aridicollis]MCS3429011.1 DNA-binding MarR family transcriptional regulator [Leucobacter aridicollis]